MNAFLNPRRLTLGVLWLGLLIFAFVFAPPDNPDTLTLIVNLSTGQWQGINPSIIALFNAMGIWPFVYAAVILVDGRGQKFPAYPFVIGSFFLGAFVLIPYLILREENPHFEGSLTWPVRVYESRITAVVLLISGLGLLWWGLVTGNWQDFIEQWQHSRFLAVMSSDFCCLSLLFPFLVADDMKRRGQLPTLGLWMTVLIPFVGALLYLVLRPPLNPEPTA
ncbi:MAG: DUF2834 domain-containing protein [Synechocystis sp.]